MQFSNIKKLIFRIWLLYLYSCVAAVLEGVGHCQIQIQTTLSEVYNL
jgi:hypothetical protein